MLRRRDIVVVGWPWSYMNILINGSTTRRALNNSLDVLKTLPALRQLLNVEVFLRAFQ